MLALLYFPAEHKYAVYTPLFASAVIPLVGAALREFFAWRRNRKERAQKIEAETISHGQPDTKDVEGERQHGARPKRD